MGYLDQRIRLYFSLALTLAVALFVFSLFTFKSIEDSKNELINDHVLRVVYFKELEVLLERDVARNRALALSGDPGLLVEGERIHSEFVRHLQKLKDIKFGNKTDELVNAIIKAKEKFVPAEKKLVEFRRKFVPSPLLVKTFEDDVKPYRIAMSEAVKNAADNEEAEFHRANTKIKAEIKKGLDVFIIGGFLLFIAGGVFFRLFYLARTEIKLAFEKLSRSNQELEEFAGVAAHDLRAPLKTMHGWVDILNTVLPQPRTPDVDTAMNFISSNTRKSCALVEDLLAVARINIDVPVTEVDLNKTVRHVLESYSGQIQATGAMISCEKLPVIWGNKKHLVLVFSNLVSNALIYRDKNRRLQINIGAHKQNSHYEFFVKDNGIGIRSEQFDRVFEMFSRLHSDDIYPGTGIGLAFCKKIVELNHGKIWVDSVPGMGSTFFFTYHSYANSGAKRRKEGFYETRRHDSR